MVVVEHELILVPSFAVGGVEASQGCEGGVVLGVGHDAHLHDVVGVAAAVPVGPEGDHEAVESGAEQREGEVGVAGVGVEVHVHAVAARMGVAGADIGVVGGGVVGVFIPAGRGDVAVGAGGPALGGLEAHEEGDGVGGALGGAGGNVGIDRGVAEV